MEFILQKSAGAVSTAAPLHNVDPFTGGGAYKSGAASSHPQPGGQTSSSTDPFTGAGGYVPGTAMDVDSGLYCACMAFIPTKKDNSYLAGGRWWQSCSDRPGAAVVIHPMTGATAALHLWNSDTNTLAQAIR